MNSTLRRDLAPWPCRVDISTSPRKGIGMHFTCVVEDASLITDASMWYLVDLLHRRHQNYFRLDENGSLGSLLGENP